MQHRLILLVIFPVFLWQCAAPREKIPPVPAMAASGEKLVIYQLLPRLFGNAREINKPYGTLDENGCGKFEDINDKALASLGELGITHVWYTGILEHAVLTDYTAYGIPLDDADVVQGRAGSPYAIKDYYDVDPDLAVDVRNRMLEFERLVERTHRHGIKVIIDFVPNHVARAYHSDAKPEGVIDLGQTDDSSKAFDPNNNFYYLLGTSFQVPKGYNALGSNSFPTKDGMFAETPAKATANDRFERMPAITDWFDAVKLNYGVDYGNGRKKYFDSIPDTWYKMRDILIFWAGKEIDGFRCDMAEMVPAEFWRWAIPQVKAVNPDVLFIAEIYNPAQYRNYLSFGRFDFLYDKVQLYDTIKLLMKGKGTTPYITRIQKSLSDINQHMVHFLENHDEQRIASPFFAGDPMKAVPGMVVSATIDKGPIMIYFGQEVGEPGDGVEGFNGDDGRTSIMDYWGVPQYQRWVNSKQFDGGLLSDEQKAVRLFYADLLRLTGHHLAVARGTYVDLTEKNVAAENFSGRIVSFARAYEDKILLVVANFNGDAEHVRIQIDPEAAGALGIQAGGRYVARDLLRSGIVIKLGDDLSLDLDVPPWGSFILSLGQ